eukprot:TRINITY_DN3872_c0_g2_i4.p1 TRINITY_DN3872_c0_g2~~TRINITY_DN3872_c0_g2_i4.p1  ORF type:complete len:1445 (-),score=614.19 TRINITY_DN3872_c0_g2_i4:22-4356(-)
MGNSHDKVLVLLKENKISQLEKMLQKGYDLNQKDEKSGKTLLHLALEDENISSTAIRYLLEKSADPNIKDNDEKTPLQMISEDNKVPAKAYGEIINALLLYKANPNALDQDTKTSFHLVCSNNKISLDIISNFLDNKADSNIKENKASKTPLHLLSANNKASVEMIKLMIEHKADPLQKDGEGKNCFEIGSKNDDISVDIINLEIKMFDKNNKKENNAKETKDNKNSKDPKKNSKEEIHLIAQNTQEDLNKLKLLARKKEDDKKEILTLDNQDTNKDTKEDKEDIDENENDVPKSKQLKALSLKKRGEINRRSVLNAFDEDKKTSPQTSEKNSEKVEIPIGKKNQNNEEHDQKDHKIEHKDDHKHDEDHKDHRNHKDKHNHHKDHKHDQKEDDNEVHKEDQKNQNQKHKDKTDHIKAHVDTPTLNEKNNNITVLHNLHEDHHGQLSTLHELSNLSGNRKTLGENLLFNPPEDQSPESCKKDKNHKTKRESEEEEIVGNEVSYSKKEIKQDDLNNENEGDKQSVVHHIRNLQSSDLQGIESVPFGDDSTESEENKSESKEEVGEEKNEENKIEEEHAEEEKKVEIKVEVKPEIKSVPVKENKVVANNTVLTIVSNRGSFFDAFAELPTEDTVTLMNEPLISPKRENTDNENKTTIKEQVRFDVKKETVTTKSPREENNNQDLSSSNQISLKSPRENTAPTKSPRKSASRENVNKLETLKSLKSSKENLLNLISPRSQQKEDNNNFLPQKSPKGENKETSVSPREVENTKEKKPPKKFFGSFLKDGSKDSLKIEIPKSDHNEHNGELLTSPKPPRPNNPPPPNRTSYPLPTQNETALSPKHISAEHIDDLEIRNAKPTSPKNNEKDQLTSPRPPRPNNPPPPNKLLSPRNNEQPLSPNNNGKEQPLSPKNNEKEKPLSPKNNEKEQPLSPNKNEKEKPLSPKNKEQPLSPKNNEKEKLLSPKNNEKEKPLSPKNNEQPLSPIKNEKEVPKVSPRDPNQPKNVSFLINNDKNNNKPKSSQKENKTSKKEEKESTEEQKQVVTLSRASTNTFKVDENFSHTSKFFQMFGGANDDEHNPRLKRKSLNFDKLSTSELNQGRHTQTDPVKSKNSENENEKVLENKDKTNNNNNSNNKVPLLKLGSLETKTSPPTNTKVSPPTKLPAKNNVVKLNLSQLSQPVKEQLPKIAKIISPKKDLPSGNIGSSNNSSSSTEKSEKPITPRDVFEGRKQFFLNFAESPKPVKTTTSPSQERLRSKTTIEAPPKKVTTTLSRKSNVEEIDVVPVLSRHVEIIDDNKNGSFDGFSDAPMMHRHVEVVETNKKDVKEVPMLQRSMDVIEFDEPITSPRNNNNSTLNALISPRNNLPSSSTTSSAPSWMEKIKFKKNINNQKLEGGTNILLSPRRSNNDESNVDIDNGGEISFSLKSSNENLQQQRFNTKNFYSQFKEEETN